MKSKRSNKKKFYLFFFLGLILAISQGQASERPLEAAFPKNAVESYGIGERLVYDVTYLGVPAGKAVMEVLEKIEMKDREVYHVLSSVRSNNFVDLFYPVDDRIETFIDVEGGYSHKIRVKQEQGRRKKDKVVRFDQIRHRAIQVKNNKVDTFLIPPRVQDSLSSLYYFRTRQSLEVGESTFIDVHESRKNWKLEIRVLGREVITTPLGTFKTIKAKAFVRYEGLFMDKGDVTLWLTDDAQHIPVLIHTDIKIGHMTATLTSGTELPFPIKMTGLLMHDS